MGRFAKTSVTWVLNIVNSFTYRLALATGSLSSVGPPFLFSPHFLILYFYFQVPIYQAPSPSETYCLTPFTLDSKLIKHQKDFHFKRGLREYESLIVTFQELESRQVCRVQDGLGEDITFHLEILCKSINPITLSLSPAELSCKVRIITSAAFGQMKRTICYS